MQLEVHENDEKNTAVPAKLLPFQEIFHRLLDYSLEFIFQHEQAFFDVDSLQNSRLFYLLRVEQHINALTDIDCEAKLNELLHAFLESMD